MEDYVSFEQAKALKELGFDIPTRYYYWIMFPEELKEGIVVADHNTEDSENHFSAPSLYQAKKWFIDKFSLVVSSLPCVTDPNVDVLKWRYYVDKYNPYIIQEGSIKVYDYFEEALSAGIDRALQILKEK
ncbi:MAG: hypothetical protein J1E16_05585 [Muribaculaceae bacterium]|nr:hypothetical protein [Muribaculaceae bacterium]